MEHILFRAMGCEIFCGVESASPRVHERLARVPAMFEAWETVLSRFRSDSELSRLNAQGGGAQVSDTLWRVAQWARRAEEWSGGLVTPTLGDALVAAGYDRSFEQISETRFCQHADARFTAAARGWDLNSADHSIRLNPHTHLEFGGIAKGWAVEQTANYLGELGPALVDAGGDMVMTAPRADGAWVIQVENPFADEAAKPLLAIERGAVATSGRDFRTWTRGDKLQHHLIDPRTGQPAVTDVLAATVIAPTIFEAEVGAKAAFLKASVAGLEWVNENVSLAALLILEEGTVLTSGGMEKFLL